MDFATATGNENSREDVGLALLSAMRPAAPIFGDKVRCYTPFFALPDGRAGVSTPHEKATATAAIAAVSVRRIVWPREACTQPATRKDCNSPSVHPPSGPIASTKCAS